MATSIVPPTNDAAATPPALPSCPNCGSSKVEAFCAHCGEQQLSNRHLSLGAIARDAAQDVVGVDGRVPRTIWALITKPGLLTREFIDGRRGRYSKPLALFLVLNLVFFVVQPHTGMLRYSLGNYIGSETDVNDGLTARMVQEKLAKSGETRASYEKRFNSTLDNQKKSMLLFAVPVFAMVMAIVFAGTRRYFVEHVVFAVHTYAFLLLVLTIGVSLFFYTVSGWLLMAELAGAPERIRSLFETEPGLVTVVLMALVTYLTLAIRRAYGGSWRAAIVRGVVLSFVPLALIALYHSVLFFTAFYAT